MLLHRFLAAILALALLLPTAAPAQPHPVTLAAQERLTYGARDNQARRMLAAYEAWVARWNIPDAAVAIMAGNRLLQSASHGAYSHRRPVPLASLSKAVTGVCIVRLVDEGRLSFDAPLRDVLRWYMRQYPPADTRVRGITVAQLLTHSSGITYDATQGPLLSGVNVRRSSAIPYANAVFGVPLGTTPGTAHFYNNINYLLLGMVIETVTGQSYLDACFQRVLAPLGITNAGFARQWYFMWAWGGWRMSVRDYGRFLTYFDAARSPLQTPQSAWPRFDLGGGAYYSIGTYMRPNASGTNFYHAGAWTWNSPTVSASYSSWYVTMRNSTIRYVTAESPRVSSSARLDLDQAMWAAAYPSFAAEDMPPPPILPE